MVYNVNMKKQKLSTKLEFYFDDQDELPLFDIIIKSKTKMPKKHIIIKKEKTSDTSTKLF